MSDTNSFSATSVRKINKLFCLNDRVGEGESGTVADHVARPNPAILAIDEHAYTCGCAPCMHPGAPRLPRAQLLIYLSATAECTVEGQTSV